MVITSIIIEIYIIELILIDCYGKCNNHTKYIKKDIELDIR